jgi:hypothetical protein
LIRTCPYPALVAEHARIQQLKWDAQEQALGCRRDAAAWDTRAAEATATEKHKAAKKAEAEAAQLLAEAAALEARAAGEVAEAVRAAEARLLDP